MASRRVLIVDSSVMVRRLLSDTIAAEKDLELIGSASSSCFALAKIASTHPDVVVIDVDAPELDALELIGEIRARFPGVLMIACGTLPPRGRRRQLFVAGAADFIVRPPCALDRSEFQTTVRAPLLDAVRRGPLPRRPSLITPEVRAARYAGFPEVCVIGASTGGPNALSTLFYQLPRPEVPVVVVQHMPPIFTTQLARRLSGESQIPFVEVEDGMPAEPKRGYIAPGDYHVRLQRNTKGLYLSLSQSARENSVRPSVDVLFSSAAETCGERVLGVVMTGMGHDGLRGCSEIRAAGGQVVVQDEASSVVWGMPGAVVQAGHADEVVALLELAGELEHRLPFSGRGRRPASS